MGSRRSAPPWRVSRPSTCGRSRARSRRSTPSSTSSSERYPRSPARRRSSPTGGRDDALVDRRHRAARRRAPARRVPAQRRPAGGEGDRPDRRGHRRDGRGGIQGPRRRPPAADHAGPGRADGRGARRVRRLARRHPRRRGAGMSAAAVVLLVGGLYPGAAAAGLRNFPDSTAIDPPRIGEVYTKGTLTLARLGREAPIAVASPGESVLRNLEGGSLAARSLYPDVRHTSPEKLPSSPVIGTGAPERYERREDIGAPRKRFPAGRS